MKGYRKILIAVNGSLDVLREGLRVARDEGCWVTVVKVIPPNEGELHLTGIKHIKDVFMAGVEKTIDEIEKIAQSERVLIKTKVEEGEISEKIIEVAEKERCDLIIIELPKKKGLKRLFGDSTVRKVIDNSSIPVLVVRNKS